MIDHSTKHAFFSSESTHSLRRTVSTSCSTALAWPKSVGLSPLVRGRVSASRGYHSHFGRVMATNAPLHYCLSFG